ncbi:MAG: PqqD family protein [Acutalibacteraceae bacterium]
MKLKYNFVTNEVADKIVAVAVGDDLEKFNGFIKMNDVGAYIFNMLKNDVTEDEIVAAMQKDFEDATEEEIREAVKEFTDKLKESDVIE